MMAMVWLKLKGLKDDYKIIMAMMVLSVVFTMFFNMSSGGETPQSIIGIYGQSPQIESILKREDIKSTSYVLRFVKSIEDTKHGNFNVVYDFSKMKTDTIDKLKAVEDMNALIGEMTFERNFINVLRSEFRNKEIAKRLTHEGYVTSADQVEAYFKSQKQRHVEMLSVDSRVIESKNKWSGYDNQLHSLLGFTIMFSMFTLTFGLSGIVLDKKYRTWQRTMVTPVKVWQMMFGHLSVTFLVGFVQIMSLFLIGKYIFNINFGQGNMPYVTLLVMAFCFAIVGIASIMAGAVKTMQQLGTLAPIIITGSAMLGGCMWPLQIVQSKVMLFLANLTPQKWLLQGIEDLIMYNKGHGTIVIPLIVLLSIGLISCGIGMFIAHKSECNY